MTSLAWPRDGGCRLSAGAAQPGARGLGSHLPRSQGDRVLHAGHLAVGPRARGHPVRGDDPRPSRGRSLRRHSETLREPLGVVQAALLTLVALILAFGLAMAVTRYEARRAAVVDDANAIGTAYLRAQTLREPVRSFSLPLFVRYTDASLALSRFVPGSAAARSAITSESLLQRRLWHLAGRALESQPTQSAPRLYVESLNEMIDMQTTRVAALNNRVPSPILLVQVVGAAVALGLLALYLAILSRGVMTVLSAVGMLTLLLFVTFDLDRPARGFITIPNAALMRCEHRWSSRRPPSRRSPRSHPSWGRLWSHPLLHGRRGNSFGWRGASPTPAEGGCPSGGGAGGRADPERGAEHDLGVADLIRSSSPAMFSATQRPRPRCRPRHRPAFPRHSVRDLAVPDRDRVGLESWLGLEDRQNALLCPAGEIMPSPLKL